MFNQKEYNKEWRNRNKEHLSKYNKEYWKRVKGTEKDYYWKNHEVMLERHKKYREENREILRKRNREWYYNNLEKSKKISHESYKKRYKKRREFINNYKLSKGCAICGYNKCAAALDFHHDGDKEFDIGKGLGNNMNFEKLKREMGKCEILCANCHRELHDKKRKDEKLP